MIKITHISIKNFGGVKNFESDLYNRTLVSGANRVGKTTIKNAIYWVLFNKLSDGSSADGIRPHDENGKDIDYIDIDVKLTIDFDGDVYEIEKLQKQERVTDRTTKEQKFKGNVNEYLVNDIPKREKDFVAFIEDFIKKDVFMFCTNPNIFLSKPTKDRKQILVDMFGAITDEEMIANNPQYEPLASRLKVGNIAEVKASLNKSKKELDNKLTTIPARIDELNMQMVKVDSETLNAEIKTLNEEITSLEMQMASIDKQGEELTNLTEKLFDAKATLVNLKSEAERETSEKRKGLAWEEQDLLKAVALNNSKVKEHKAEVEKYNSLVARSNNELEELRAKWNEVNEAEFDNSNLICPTCGNSFSEDKADEIRKEFETGKTKKLSNLTEEAKELQKKIDDYNAKAMLFSEEIETILAKNEALATEQERVKAEMENIVVADVTTTAEYKDAEKKVETLEKKLAKFSDNKELKDNIMASISEKNARIVEISKELAKSDKNAELEKRIEDLNVERLEITQRVADMNRLIDLLKEYERMKLTALTDKINSHFHIIKWQMFKEQVNGDFADVCTPLVDGTSYDGLLNHGNKILAEIDLCRAFQSANNVLCPIMIDDSESVDMWRVPEIESQLIILRRTDDKEISVKEL